MEPSSVVRSVLGSGHEQDENVTSHCSHRMSPPELRASAQPKELPKLTGSRGPQTVPQSKKDSREMLAFCVGATGPIPQPGQGVMCCRQVAPLPGWSEQLAPASAPFLFRDP